MSYISGLNEGWSTPLDGENFFSIAEIRTRVLNIKSESPSHSTTTNDHTNT